MNQEAMPGPGSETCTVAACKKKRGDFFYDKSENESYLKGL